MALTQYNLGPSGVFARLQSEEANILVNGHSNWNFTGVSPWLPRYNPRVSGLWLPLRFSADASNGYSVFHNFTGTNAEYAADNNGIFSDYANKLPMPRREMVAASNVTTANMERAWLDSTIKPGGANEWLVDPFAGKDVKCSIIHVQHDDGLAALGSFQTRLASTGGGTVHAGTVDWATYAATPTMVMLEATIEDVPSDWTAVGWRTTQKVGVDETGKGAIHLFGGICADVATPFTIGWMAEGGQTVQRWIDRTDADELAVLFRLMRTSVMWWCFGANDATAVVSAADFKSRMRTAIEKADAAHAVAQGIDDTIPDLKHLIIADQDMADRTALLEAYALAARELCDEPERRANTATISMFHMFGTSDELFAAGYVDADRIHWTTSGRPIAAAAVWDQLSTVIGGNAAQCRLSLGMGMGL